MPPDPDRITRSNIETWRKRIRDIDHTIAAKAREIGQLERDRDRILIRIAESERTLNAQDR